MSSQSFLQLSKIVLKKHNLHITQNRVNVLTYLLKQKEAIHKLNIEKHFTHIDTVTIYRMLLSFVEKGILHTVNNDKGEMLYAICNDNCNEEQHFHNHIHFSCTVCSKTFCLEHIHIPEVKLPKGYIFQHTEMHITGICKDCNTSKIKAIKV